MSERNIYRLFLCHNFCCQQQKVIYIPIVFATKTRQNTAFPIQDKEDYETNTRVFIPFIPGNFVTLKTLNRNKICCLQIIPFYSTQLVLGARRKMKCKFHFSWIQFSSFCTSSFKMLLSSPPSLFCVIPTGSQAAAPKAVFCILVDSLSLLLVWLVGGSRLWSLFDGQTTTSSIALSSNMVL